MRNETERKPLGIPIGIPMRILSPEEASEMEFSPAQKKELQRRFRDLENAEVGTTLSQMAFRDR